jgi:serine/threonine-protein kinase
MPAIPARVSELSPPDRLQLEAWLAEFEETWDEGRLADRVERLPAPGQPLRLPALIELVKIDLERTWQCGRHLSVADYLTRYPELGPAEALPPDLLLAEEEVRRQFGDVPATLPPAPDGAEASPPTLARPAPQAASRVPRVSGYDVLGRLGEGGMGIVWRGRDCQLRRDVAIKVMKGELAGQPQLVRRFIEEAQVASQLAHPAIPPVHELGELSDGRPYFVMKVVRGRTLADQLEARAGPADDRPRLLAVFEQVCQGVAYAHSKGVIHRDLKPANVMVGAFGEVQLMDWGLAKVLTGPPAAVGDVDRPVAVVETARAAESDDATQVGSVLGTYAYMAPEQSRGEVDRLDRRCDVFGLGAILCEVLTGQPPYVGTVEEVKAQTQLGHLAPARERLAACGADAELVELAKRCLGSRAEERPADATAVAAALTAHLAGVQDRLRQAELERAAAQARAAEERKRRRVQLALAAVVLLVAAVGGGGAWWVRQERAGRQQERAAQWQAAARAIETALDKASALRQQARRAEARVVLEQARERLGETGPADLRGPLEQALADLDLVDRLEEIRRRRATSFVDGWLDGRGAEQDYAEALSQAGLGEEGEDAEAVAARIRDSAIRDQLVAALDDWAAVTKDSRRQAWLLEVARRTDPDVWGRRFRDPEVWRDQGKLRALAEDALRDDGAKLGELSPQVLAALGHLLGGGPRAVPLWRAAQRCYPSDFWLNLYLAIALDEAKQIEEAVGYFRVAVALRPGAAIAHVCLGNALKHKGDQDGAIREYKEAIALEPKLAVAHSNLGGALRAKGDREGAIRECQKAVALEPKLAVAHNNLGFTLEYTGDLDGAIREYQKAVALEPRNAIGHANLGRAAALAGQWDKAAASFTVTQELDPGNHWTWFLGAPLLLQTGDLPGYRRACREMLARFGKTDAADVAERTAKTCLLVPGAVGDLESVVSLADLAVKKNGSARWPLLTKALAEYRAGRCAVAIEWLQRVVPDAGGGSLDATALAVLAMARKQQGQAEEARKALEQARAILAQKLPQPDRGQHFDGDWHNWLRSQILCREAESLLGTKDKDTRPKHTKGP